MAWRNGGCHGLGAVLLLTTTFACSGSGAPPDLASERGGRVPNVLIVTIDTLRADRLPAYGFSGVATPAIDELRRDGVLFTNAHSTTPLTLPAHTSLFTGNYPLRHGVIDNGGFLVPEGADTLAEVLRSAGYRTGAFVGAYVLDHRWRLNQGFDVYFDDFDVRGQRVIAMGGVQRPASEVLDHALPWLEERSDRPFFLWLHMYDPHAPYEPPEPFKSRYPRHPYLGEIAYTDSQLGRLLAELERLDLLRTTLIVLAADHGESLGQHGEAQHGFFIYEESMHVPLIMRIPYGNYRGMRHDQPVSIVDVMPTVLEMVGVDAGLEFQGRSLAPLLEGGQFAQPRYLYAESWYARLHYGWSDLRSLRGERYKLILSSEPELYDLQEDPKEFDNLVGTANSVEFRLTRAAEKLIPAWSEGADPADAADLDEETRRKLVSLGYVGSFKALEGDRAELASPRTKIAVYNRSLEARQAMNRGDHETAEELLRQVLADDPGIIDAYHTLGELYFDQGRMQDAVDAYRAAIPLKPDDPYAYIFLTDALVRMGRLDEAERVVRDALEVIQSNAQLYFLLGDVSRRQGKMQIAEAAFRQCLELNPDGGSARGGLAQIYFLDGRLSDAERIAREALEYNDRLPGVHAVLAEIHDARGEHAAAVGEYEQELINSPKDVAAHFNLAMVFRKMGREADEERQLDRVLELDPDYALGNLFMARLLLAHGSDYERAIRMVEGAIEQQLDKPDLTLGYFLLADLYNRIGQADRSQEWARRGQRLRQQGDRE